jgi:hypothetical protein
VSGKVYTLLIVESPVLARLIQQHAPGSIYVMATDGYGWRPSFDPPSGSLRATADPGKRDFRKELKEQAEIAGDVIIATDPDPSGDFIAWATARFLKRPVIKRGQIQSITRSGILHLLSEPEEQNITQLEHRLKNRFLIQHLWKQQNLPDIQHAALAALFAGLTPASRFIDSNRRLWESSAPVQTDRDEWLPVHSSVGGSTFRIAKPLSTFDVVADGVENGIEPRFEDLQFALYQLFQTPLHHSRESLISYPRTDSNAFYSSTWEQLNAQFLNFGGENQFKPGFLREIAAPDQPHESIHPLTLQHTPESVSGELSSVSGKLYRMIYQRTMEAIKMPQPLDSAAVCEWFPDLYFYPVAGNQPQIPDSLRPVITSSCAGAALSRLGALRPSSFGSRMDTWLNEGVVRKNGPLLSPGPKLNPLLPRASIYHRIMIRLRELADEPVLHRETIREALSCNES